MPLCLRHPPLSLQLTRSWVAGVLRVALEQGNPGNHCVPHEYFFSQMEKEGKEAVVITLTWSDRREIKNIQLGQRPTKTLSERKYMKY